MMPEPTPPTRQRRSPFEVRRLTLRAAATAAAITAQHVVVKATRDALFLSHFGAKHLPFALVGAAAVSGASVLVLSRAMPGRGPSRLVAPLFVASACALAGIRVAAAFSEAVAAVLLYAEIGLFGATGMSAFWSAVSESFDPHRGRQAISRIAAGSALGGIAGGLLAWQGARWIDGRSILLCVAALQLLAALGSRGLVARQRDSSPPPAATSGLKAVRTTPYLRALAVLVVLVSAGDALFEFAMSSNAVAALGSQARLLSFFAAFQTAVGLLSFVLQTTLARRALDRLGVGKTAAIMPFAALAGGALGALAHRLVMTTVVRASQAALQASLHKSTYEVLYTPLPTGLKRPAKTVIDVSFDRRGTAIGGLLALLIVSLAPRSAVTIALVLGALLAVATLAVVQRLQAGYVEALASNLKVQGPTPASILPSAETIRRADVLRALVERTSTVPPAERHAVSYDGEAGVALRDAIRHAAAAKRGAPPIDRVLVLLSRVFPQSPLRAAHQALCSDDELLRGNALEYLHEALPGSVRMLVWANLDAHDRAD